MKLVLKQRSRRTDPLVVETAGDTSSDEDVQAAITQIVEAIATDISEGIQYDGVDVDGMTFEITYERQSEVF